MRDSSHMTLSVSGLRAEGHRRKHRGSRGQGLLVMILVMFVLLIIAALFLAALTHNLSQTGRTREYGRALELAQAGIRFADDNLTNSPLGADWRPPGSPSPVPGDYYDTFEKARGWDQPDPKTGVRFTKYPGPNTLMGKGQFLLKVEYDPGALRDDPLGKCLKITAIGRSPERPSVYAMVTAYKPILITDYLRLVTNPDRSSAQDQLGVPPNFDWDGDGTYNYAPATDPAKTLVREDNGKDLSEPAFVSEFYGPLHSQSDLFVFGLNKFFLHPFLDGAGYRRDKVEASGAFTFDPNYATALTMYLYDYSLSPPDFDLDNPHLGLDSRDVAWNSRYVRQTLTDPSTGEVFYRDDRVTVDASVDPSREVARVGPPDPFSVAPLTNRRRYLELTRNSGRWLTVARGLGTFTFNTGWYGYGEGIYIDNFSDLHHEHNIPALIEQLGLPDPDIPDGSTARADDGQNGAWDATGKVYQPPAVRIILLSKNVDLTSQDRTQIPDDPGRPDILVTRTDAGGGGETSPGWDGSWRNVQDATNTTFTQGQYVELDYPRNGVIYCEGDVRIRGDLPLLAHYGLTVVSGGAIYIEGAIRRPSDRQETGAYSDDNTHLALIARDVVALNPGTSAPPVEDEVLALLPDAYSVKTDTSRESDARDGSYPYHQLLMPGQYYWYATTIGEWDSTTPPTVTLTHSGDVSLEPGERTELQMFVNGKEFDFQPSTPSTTDPYLFFPHPMASVANENESNAVGKNYETRMWSLEDYVAPGPTTVSIELRLGEGSQKPYWLGGLHVTPPPLEIVAALAYSQRGPWFVVAGNLQNPSARGLTPEPRDPLAQDALTRRFGQQIAFYGAIAEAHSAPAAAVRRWIDYRAYVAGSEPDPVTCTPPAGGADYRLPRWRSILYRYDGSWGSSRGRNLARCPALPASRTLIYRR